ncbi:Pol Polyprotein [Phytophthora megakarya]|uniref:Pol Polyprotein n=1 Tax=Phytophthora megakarya TaxID=4795 RepID=A0A225UIQ3_9STRA|nr:Pol Polyprotein [Phytophthora megakarya]
MFALRASHHSMAKSSPDQQTFGRNMIFDMKYETNWIGEIDLKKYNERENLKRLNWEYIPGDKVLIRRDAGVQAKVLPLYDVPY